MELKDFFALVGGDAQQVLDRLPSEAMIRRFLHKFIADPSYKELGKALENEDFSTAFRAAHTLKGTAANLGLDTLASAASELTEALRNTSAQPSDHLLKAVDTAYETAVSQIEQLDD